MPLKVDPWGLIPAWQTVLLERIKRIGSEGLATEDYLYRCQKRGFDD